MANSGQKPGLADRTKGAGKIRGMVSLYSKLLGLSREGLKFYERKGLLSPDRDSCNDYRIYRQDEIHLIFQCKKYRKFEFKLDSIAALMRQAGHEEVLSQFRARRDSLKKEIDEKKKTLASLDEKIRQIEAETGQGFSILTRPAIYWLPFMVNGSPVDDERHILRLRRWMDTIAHTEGIVVWPLDKITGCQGDVYEGYMIEAKNAAARPLKKNARYLPEAPCVYTVKEIQHDSESNPLFTPSLFSGMLDYMKARDLKPAGDGTARIIRGFIDTRKTYHFILELWLPFSPL